MSTPDRLLGPVKKLGERFGYGRSANPEDQKMVFPNENKEEIPTAIVDLPSSGVFYSGTLAVAVSRTLSVAQVRQLYGIRNLQNPYNRKRELVNIIGRSIQGYDFLDLTWPDFQYILYWLRLNSYKKAPYTIQWEYPVVPATDEAPAVMKSVLSHVQMTDFDIRTLDRHKKFEYEYETVRMYLERLELEDESEVWLSKFAACYPRGNTLKARISALEACSDDKLYDIRQFQATAQHGVVSTVHLRDPDNPAAGDFPFVLEMDVTDFFR